VAKTRAQRKAEQRRRAAEGANPPSSQERARRRTQVPESADVVEAQMAEAGVEIPGPTHEEAVPEEQELEAPAPSRADVGRPEQAEADEAPERISRRERRRQERERAARAKASQQRRAPKEAAPERRRGRVLAFLISCWAELKKVQWPDRETLVQASGVTILFIAIAAAYLGALDSVFNFLVQHLL
jgi:preprotein translocase SecE subunit